MTTQRPASPRKAGDVAAWDHAADVVVAGYGVAGASAAVEAATLGADVLVLERTGGWGGAAAMAGGFIYMGGGTAIQKACGFEDTPDEMFKFLMAAMGPGADEAKTRVFCDESVDHFDWLVECGVPFKPEFYGEPGWEPGADEGLMYSGGENAAPFTEIAKPAPRGHLPQMENKKTGERGGGYMLMKPLVETAERLGVRALYDMRTDRLIVDETDRVIGVVATRHGKELCIRANKGVVLAAGSFVYNDDMVARFAPLILGRPGSAIDEHDGQAIRAAQAIGADLSHMDGAEVALGVDPQLLYRGIMVNAQGQRFINEDTYPGRVGQATLYHQNNEVFLVIDEKGYEEAPVHPRMAEMRYPPTWVCGSVAELEVEMGMPTGALESTLDYYNKHAAEGKDPLFNKVEKWTRPLGTPIGAFDFRNFTGGFTLGGLHTNPASEVLHVDGHAIAGLYAAGRTTSGIPAWGYASGASLGDGSFFGRRAGRSAVENS